MSELTQSPMRAPRRDQLRNRRRLIDAAREAFVAGEVEISLDEIASRAGLATSSLFRHFPAKDDLFEAIMNDLLEGVRVGAGAAMEIAAPDDALRHLLSRSCRMSDAETSAFAALAQSSQRLGQFADELIGQIVAPAAARLRESPGFRDDISIDDITLFVRMLELARSEQQRDRIIDVMLSGLVARQ